MLFDCLCSVHVCIFSIVMLPRNYKYEVMNGLVCPVARAILVVRRWEGRMHNSGDVLEALWSAGRHVY